MLGAGIEVIRSRNFPTTFPLTVVVRLKNIINKLQNTTLEFDVFREDGHSILDAPYVSVLESGDRPPLGSVVSEGSGNVLLGIPGLLIPMAGTYRLVLKLTGEDMVARNFRLVAEERHD